MENQKHLEFEILVQLENATTKIAQKIYDVLNREGIPGIIVKDNVFWFEYYSIGNNCPAYVYKWLKKYIKRKYGYNYLYDVIDSGYRNEWFVPITNTTDKTLYIAKNTSDINVNNKDSFAYPYGKAIAQAIIIPVPQVDIEEYTYDELKAIPSQRGNGALGSSGK